MKKRLLQRIIIPGLLVFSMLTYSGCTMLDMVDYMLEDEEETAQLPEQPGEGKELEAESTGSGNWTAGSDDAAFAESEERRTEAISSLYENGAVREPKVKLKGNGQDKVTILIYMNGSDLESDSQEATGDLAEMVHAGSSSNVNILVQTMGTKKWYNYGIASNRSQIYSVNGNGLTLVKDDLGQLDCTGPDALSSFIAWGAANYPADRYILLFWNHGGGPVYGFGSDEWNSDQYASLTIDEMQTALSRGGIYFDIIGMDCCIMSCIEVCAALYEYCDYMVLSEDFESGLGWNYTPWLSSLYSNTSIRSTDLGRRIVDSMVDANAQDSYNGDNSILAVIDQAMLKVLWQTWTDFAYANESALLNSNYSREVKRSDNGRVHPILRRQGRTLRYGGYDSWDDFSYSDYYSDDVPDLSEYYITDIMAVASTMDTVESNALRSALDSTIVYMKATEGDRDLTGISVTLPYGDEAFYADLNRIFTNAGFDTDYVSWLSKFTSASGTGSFYDYSDWDDDWDGWDDYNDDYDWNEWDYGGGDDYDYWFDWDFWGDFADDDGCYDYGYYDDDDYYGCYDDYYYEDDGYYYGDDYYSYDDSEYEWFWGNW